MASKASSVAVLKGGLDVCTRDTESGSGHLQPLFHALLPGHRWQVSCHLCGLSKGEESLTHACVNHVGHSCAPAAYERMLSAPDRSIRKPLSCALHALLVA